MPPKTLTVASTQLLIWPSSRRSVRWKMAPLPAALAAALPACSSISAIRTETLQSASFLATRAPISVAPPVTIATLLARPRVAHPPHYTTTAEHHEHRSPNDPPGTYHPML